MDSVEKELRIQIRAIELKNASHDFNELRWDQLLETEQRKFLYLARKSFKEEE